MDQSRQFYQREKGTTAPVGMVDDAQLAKWALETEIEEGKGAARRGGKWKVNGIPLCPNAVKLAVFVTS